MPSEPGRALARGVAFPEHQVAIGNELAMSARVWGGTWRDVAEYRDAKRRVATVLWDAANGL